MRRGAATTGGYVEVPEDWYPQGQWAIWCARCFRAGFRCGVEADGRCKGCELRDFYESKGASDAQYQL